MLHSEEDHTCPLRPLPTRVLSKGEEKKAKGKVGKKDSSKSKDATTKAHTTVTEREHESDSSDEESEAGGTSNFTSFSCSCATRSSTLTSESMVYFNNFSNLNFIKDKAWPWTSKPSP